MQLECYLCPKCGAEHFGLGRLGTSVQCRCGTWLPHSELDRVRHYWILQIAICFALATFFCALALFFNDLPNDPWERFFDPLLQVPAFASFVVSHRIVIRYKRICDDDDRLLRYYFWGICLMSAGIIVSVLEAISNPG